MKLENIKSLIVLKSKNFRKLIANWIYPEPTTHSILESQIEYIKMLQDSLGKSYGLITGMIQPIIEANKSINAVLESQIKYDNKLKNLEYAYALRNEQRQAANSQSE